MEEFETDIEYDGNIPEEFRAVQQCLDSFVEVNYATAENLVASIKLTPEDTRHYQGKILDIVRNNPPFESIPKYFHDDREDYLWYSDFYSEISKEVYHKYRTFIVPSNEITSTNYAEELAKIDLPYFQELVNLIGLERLCKKYHIDEPIKEVELAKEELPTKDQVVTKPSTPSPKPKRLSAKRSYESKLNKERYTLLAKCIETIKLFRRPLKVSELRKLFTGKLIDPLQVTNQKSLVYLLDQLREYKYIKDAWMAVATENKDFISFRTDGNKERYGNEAHYINMTQMNNCRNRNKKELIHGLENIDDLMELMNKNQVTIQPNRHELFSFIA